VSAKFEAALKKVQDLEHTIYTLYNEKLFDEHTMLLLQTAISMAKTDLEVWEQEGKKWN